jgi:hypothetical protein
MDQLDVSWIIRGICAAFFRILTGIPFSFTIQRDSSDVCPTFYLSVPIQYFHFRLLQDAYFSQINEGWGTRGAYSLPHLRGLWSGFLVCCGTRPS